MNEARERSWIDRPLAQLTLVRFREFCPRAGGTVLGFHLSRPAGGGPGNRFPQPAGGCSQSGGRDAGVGAIDARGEIARGATVAAGASPGGAAHRQGGAGGGAGAGGAVVYRYDATNPEGRTARMLADRAIQRAAGRTDPVVATDSLIREPGSRYIDFLLPGLLGMNLMGSAIWGMGFAIVDARRKKLIKRLVATPMPRHYYLLSFIFSRLALLVVEVGVVLGFGALVFQVPVRGPFLDLALLCVLGSMSFCALGLLIASRARTIEAASGLMNVTMMPMWIVSGVFFSSARFPSVLQPAIKALPLTAVIDALRGIMLQGAGLAQVAPQAAVLGAWLVVCFGLALKLFRWR